ncbi:hypothetical protein D6D12_00366 [Aureobasidium pullulans]|uniref:Secreted protein n=1 Tax=Aureobasidium pullulans TaxID=5580 RepID=A0AB74K766_AURPU|nr:hypothetical protein D6D12_00366 [Aureobasidium pullulans]THX65763.1 hypothetical protein D6D11_00198 [Aureobasidium pullulans]
MVVAIGLDLLPWSMLLGLARQSPVAEPQSHIQERSARPVPLAGQSAVAVLVTGDVGGFRRQQRQLAEHDSGLETVEAIVVGVALVVLDDLAVAEVGVEAALGHGTADVDAVMFVMGGVHGVAGCGQVLRDCSNHERGDGENFRRDSQQVHKRGVSMDGR